MLHRQKKGYMTLEATMVMPLITVGIVFIIYLSFYLYDVSVIRQISYVAALRAAQQNDFTIEERKEYAKKQLEELLENRLLAIGQREEKIQVSMGKVKIQIAATVQMPFSGFLSEKIGLWKMNSEAEAVIVNPVKIIRSKRGG